MLTLSPQSYLLEDGNDQGLQFHPLTITLSKLQLITFFTAFFECIWILSGDWPFHYSYLFDYIGAQCFATLQIFLLTNSTLPLWVACEFGIGITCMLTTWHYVHVHCFLWVHSAHIMHLNFDCFASLNAFDYVHTL